MPTDDRYYTFLLTHSSRSKIYIRRIEVSKNLIKSTAAGLVMTFGLTTIGVFGLMNIDREVLAKSFRPAKNETVAVAGKIDLKPAVPTSAADQAINYDRPDQADKVLNNAGGPKGADFTGNENIDLSPEVEEQVKQIAKYITSENLPNIWAHQGKINNEFGFRRNPFGGRAYEFHGGMDIDGEKGDSVIAPGGGVVTKAGWQGGYGNMIELDHGNGFVTRYGHLSAVQVQVGDTIARGQVIGLVGSTGRSTGPHLHYEIRINDKPINPRRFLPTEITDLSKLPQTEK